MSGDHGASPQPCPPLFGLLPVAFLPPHASSGSPFTDTSPHLTTPRLQKILAESPPPARLDIQLPVISDDFKFQVWRKMFRALMPGTGQGLLWVYVCNCMVDGRPQPHTERFHNPGREDYRRRCPLPLYPCTLETCAKRKNFETMGFTGG